MARPYVHQRDGVVYPLSDEFRLQVQIDRRNNSGISVTDWVQKGRRDQGRLVRDEFSNVNQKLAEAKNTKYLTYFYIIFINFSLFQINIYVYISII